MVHTGSPLPYPIPIYSPTPLPYSPTFTYTQDIDMTDKEYNSTPQALYRQGKITREQLAYMLTQEIKAMLQSQSDG